METKAAFGRALKLSRQAKNLSQESFGDVSGRTYLSKLERGLVNTTIDKVADLSSVLGIHPLTLLALTFSLVEERPAEGLLSESHAELAELLAEIDKKTPES